MNENDIIEAYECCLIEDCECCPLIDTDNCVEECKWEVLDLLKRFKAENDNLRAVLDSMREDDEVD